METSGSNKNVNKTIAVLPFVNRSTGKDNEFFSDGVTEEIINALAKIKGLKAGAEQTLYLMLGQLGFRGGLKMVRGKAP